MHVMSMTEQVGVLIAPRRPHIPLGPEVGLNAEKKQWHSKKHERWRNFIIFFLAHVISQQLTLNMVTQKEGEGQGNP